MPGFECSCISCFTGNKARNQIANTTMFFLTEEAKETVLDFSQGTVKVLWIYFTLRVNEGLFLLLSYIVLDCGFEYVILSILNSHPCFFN